MLRRYYGKISFLDINEFVGKDGELVVDDTTGRVYVMDGVTLGGQELVGGLIDGNINLGNLYVIGQTIVPADLSANVEIIGNVLIDHMRGNSFEASIGGGFNNGFGGFRFADPYAPEGTVTGLVHSNIYYTLNLVHGSNVGILVHQDGAVTMPNGLRGNIFASGRNDLTIASNLIPSFGNLELGSIDNPWSSLYVSNNTVYLGGIPISLEPGTNELSVNNVPISQTLTYANIPDAPSDISDLTDTGGLLVGNGGGLSISDFGIGFTDALDAGKITTSKLYNENPDPGLNNQYTLEVTDGGVVALPDGSIINGATLKTIAGNYAGITAGPASPAGRDEDSWVWVDNDGATIATKYSTDNYQWKFDNTGNLILPNGQSIGSGSLDGIKMTTDRGTVLFGNSPECVPTLLTHFHIMKDDPANVDLFLGDDNNYVKLPGNSETAYGVEIGTNVGSAYTWRFGTDGDLTLPEGGDILNSNGDSVLGGGSYTPDDSDNWNDPTVNTISAALDELAAKVAALENFEIDGGNAYTPAAGELIIDGNGT